jgi:hypothetical protein
MLQGQPFFSRTEGEACRTVNAVQSFISDLDGSYFIVITTVGAHDFEVTTESDACGVCRKTNDNGSRESG